MSASPRTSSAAASIITSDTAAGLGSVFQAGRRRAAGLCDTAPTPRPVAHLSVTPWPSRIPIATINVALIAGTMRLVEVGRCLIKTISML
jgi:hypothetical protein